MTKKRTSRNSFARGTWALVLALIFAICLSCVSMAATETFEQTLHVKQTVTGKAQKTKYTYRLTPINQGPLPAEAGEGAEYYDFEMDGNSNTDLKLYFPADVEKDYKYELVRQGTVPAGDTVTPDKHIFGYWVKTDETGKLVIIPYTCYNNEFKISTDANGNPTDVTLEINKIVGKDNSTTSTTKSTTRSTTRSTTTNRYSTRSTTYTNVVTRTVNRVVNTGDPYQVGIWVALLALSLMAMILIAAIKRKKEKDEEDS